MPIFLKENVNTIDILNKSNEKDNMSINRNALL